MRFLLFICCTFLVSQVYAYGDNVSIRPEEDMRSKTSDAERKSARRAQQKMEEAPRKEEESFRTRETEETFGMDSPMTSEEE